MRLGTFASGSSRGFGSSVKTLRIVTFTTNGSFTVPSDVTELTVTAVGGGGGAGGSFLNTSQTAWNGGSGTSGQIVSGKLTVTPGSILSIIPGTGGRFGSDSFYTAAGGSNGIGYANGVSGTTNANGSGGGGGASSAILSGATPLVVAAGGSGGAGAVGGGGGAGGSGGGSNVVPTGFTATIATNGGIGASLSLKYSGSYSNGTGTGQIDAIRATLVASYPYLYSYINSVVGNNPDFNFPLTLSAGTALIAFNGGAGYRLYPAYSTPYTVLNAGAFGVGRTVSGINFATGNTQNNGGQSFWFWYGFTYNPGGNGYVTIQYYTNNLQ